MFIISGIKNSYKMEDSDIIIEDLKSEDLKKNNDVNILKNFKEYLHFLKDYKLLVFLLLLFILLNELAKLGEKYIFKEIIDRANDFVTGVILKNIFVNLLIFFAILFVFLITMQVALRWFRIHILNKLDGEMMKNIKIKYFSHILDLPYSFHVSNKTGSIITKLNRGGNAVESMTDSLIFNLIPMIFQLIAVVFSLLFLDIISASIILLVVFSFVAYSLVLQKKSRKLRKFANDSDDTEKNYVSDIFTNVESIKYFGKEKNIKERFSVIAKKTMDAFVSSWNLYRNIDAMQTLILGIGTLLLLSFSIIKFLNFQITIGTVVFIYTLYGNLLPALYGFVHGMRDFNRSITDFDSLFSYGKFDIELDDSKAKEVIIKKGTIDFDSVSFKFNKKKVLLDISFSIKKNETVAIVGHSGSGKTTLIKLLYRFYEPESGTIKIDGENILNMKRSFLRSQLSIVPQDCVLFDDTLYNNILFSNPLASRDEVFSAMHFAQLDSVIKRLPEKEETVVGERGVKLSGGEKQRVSIARAVLANKNILIFDEATSALDSKTEHDIQEGLGKLFKGRTTIIIAHRLSTIMNSDRIFVLDRGKIVQVGKHDDLIVQEGPYKKLWDLQKGGYIK